MKEVKRPKVGDAVIYHDEHGHPHAALVTIDWGGSINLVYVSPNAERKDQYGRQIERASSVVDRGPNGVHGRYWRWPEDAPLPPRPPLPDVIGQA